MNMNNTIKFDKENCVGCKLCYKACFIDVIRWDDEHSIPEFKYVEDCVHCNYCEVMCAKKCIEVVPDFEGEKLHQSFDRYK